MSGRSMNWGAPLSTEIAYPASDSLIYRKITSVSMFGNRDELEAFLHYSECCMLESEPEKMSNAEL